jgi:hypothetical protein
MPPPREPKSVLIALEAACRAHPSQRVAQVVVNALGADPFYVEDDEAASELYKYAALQD